MNALLEPTPAVSGDGCKMKTKEKASVLTLFFYDEDAAAVESIRSRTFGLSEKNYLTAVGRQAIMEIAAAKRTPSKAMRERCENVGTNKRVVMFRLNKQFREMLDGVAARCEFTSAAAAMRFCLHAAAELGAKKGNEP